MTGVEEGQAPLLLMTPGPSRVPEPVLRAGGRPMIHHRSPEFSSALAVVIERLRILFGAGGYALPVHATGRGSMEASICNLFSPKDEILCCCNGKFGEMWARFAESYGLVVHRICTDWELGIDPEEVRAGFQKHPRVKAVTFAHCESTTGALSDPAEVTSIARSHGALSLVDCICSLGGIPFHFDRWGVDVAITSSQKCLMASPGLSFVMLSSRAWDAAGRSKLPCNYWDFRAIRDSIGTDNPETPGTTPVHLILQVEAALGLILEEGIDDVYSRHAEMSGMILDRLPDLGLSLQCNNLQRLSPTLTAIAVPAGTRPEVIRGAMRDRGILIAAGIGPFRPSAIRIGHLGDIRPGDVSHTLDVLEGVLRENPVATE